MFRRAALLLCTLAASAALGACTPTVAFQGYQPIEARPQDVKVGEDTKSGVLVRLGSPSAVSTFDPNIWFYMTQITTRVAYYHPRVATRSIVAIAFNKEDEKVASVNSYTLKDGKVIAFNDRETPTRGRELSILEQLLGNVGQGQGLLPNNDQDIPGSRPGGQ
jgi:outer membrane protein assembly factor BamE (lipoprotein component of BamABCDE complex)